MRMEQLDRYGPWAVITGASGGIGREFAVNLASRGFNLMLVARRREALAALADSLAVEHDIDVMICAADLCERAAVDEVIEKARALDVGLLIANAGFGTSGPFVQGDLETERDLLAVNCEAVLALTHTFARRLSSRGRGGIVMMSSVVGFQGAPMAANYAASKAYVQSLAEALSHELADSGVDVLASAPGPVATGFADRAGMQMGASLSPEVVAQSTLAALGKRTTVRPGWLSRLLAWSLQTVPRWGRIRIMGAVMGGMTRHQSEGSAGPIVGEAGS